MGWSLDNNKCIYIVKDQIRIENVDVDWMNSSFFIREFERIRVQSGPESPIDGWIGLLMDSWGQSGPDPIVEKGTHN